ncbi:BrnT family toxin [Bordetella sp. FB-8]|uniref:BrnT family toxin n=1 Tax=Bordetella sp. FB-8 TaxID=1159870 RepID=UPI000364C4AB|nr:BrnT family toxin [Bordetella sp. FB-8]
MTYLSFDPAKSARNVALRGLPFEAANDFDWSSAQIAEDHRRHYGERRFQALGFIEGKLHMLVFTPRDGMLRIISLRKANSREIKRYAQKAAQFRTDR